MKIALHFRSSEGPKMVEYPYDLTLCMDRDISMTSFKVATFFNPTPDFKAKLLRAGAVRPLLYSHAHILFVFNAVPPPLNALFRVA